MKREVGQYYWALLYDIWVITQYDGNEYWLVSGYSNPFETSDFIKIKEERILPPQN